MPRKLMFLFVILIAVLVAQSNPRARVVFQDRFEYTVGRTDPNARNIFIQNGWTHVKTQQSGGGAGFFHTVTSIPGFTGAFPGTNSSRVLAIEALPSVYGGQTDFYLQMGDGGSAAFDDHIPGDVWFQFWIYSQNYGNQVSTYGTRNKFLYVCNGPYGCQSHLWMLSQGSGTNAPHHQFPHGNPSVGHFYTYLSAAQGVSQISYGGGSDVGHSNLSEWIRPNRWTLVKMHFNTTSTSGNSWEAWVRPYGAQWTKVAEWIGGRTPGFTWNIPSSEVGGHRVLRMPTTVGGPTSQWYDYWMFMDDFVMATTEGDLPTYGDAPSSGGPRPPTNVRILRALFDAFRFPRNLS